MSFALCNEDFYLSRVIPAYDKRSPDELRLGRPCRSLCDNHAVTLALWDEERETREDPP